MAQNKKRQQQEDEATAHAFQEFLETFQNSSPMTKTFIQSGVYIPGVNATNQSTETSTKIYAPKKPTYSSNATQKALECARFVKDDQPKITKRKSNLEELKLELEHRHQDAQQKLYDQQTTSMSKKIKLDQNAMDQTTNLFLTNLNCSLKEQDLMQIFGHYGPLASVKIMWPRTPSLNRGYNIGFVGFMSRRDCVRAFEALSNRSDMKISWGKPIDIPAQPVYIPPELVKTMLPPPFTGLPFNAQAPHMKIQYKINDDKSLIQPMIKYDLNTVDLCKTFVKVTIPLDKKVLCAIHRTIEFVVREGPDFEKLIMQREFYNPTYKFLFDYKSSMHIYYRWKLYSILHGESINTWSTVPFRMFQGGSIWFPPTLPDYTKGMDVGLLTDKSKQSHAKWLTDSDQRRLIDMIRNLTPQRSRVAEVMVFCIDKMVAAGDIVCILVESFETRISDTGLLSRERAAKMIARLYLISDLLYNAQQQKCIEFTTLMGRNILRIINALDLAIKQYRQQEDYHILDVMKLRIWKVCKAWRISLLFPKEVLERLVEVISENGSCRHVDMEWTKEFMLLKSTKTETLKPIVKEFNYKAFVQSKWETQRPEVVEAQAMSTAKMKEIAMQSKNEDELRQKELVKTGPGKQLNYDDLRRVEMKVIRYQDSLESGKRKLKYGKTLEEDVNEYRLKCIKKMQMKKSPKEQERNQRYRNYKR